MSKAVQNTSELTSAIDDIRHKLVEEPWFGQSTTDNIEMALHNLEGQDQSFESFYGIQPENDTQSQNQSTEHTQQIESSQEQTQQYEHTQYEQDV